MTPEQAEELWAVVKKVGYAFDSNSVILCVPNELVTYIDGAISKGIALPPRPKTESITAARIADSSSASKENIATNVDKD